MNFKLPSTAANELDFDIIRDIVDFGLCADAGAWYRERNMTPLMIAVYRGDPQNVQFLIESGADVNSRDKYDVTATHLAVDNNQYECLKVLLNAKANCSVQVKDAKNCYPYINGTTPLHLAAGINNIKCVKELLRYGADYNAVDENNITPLYLAAKAGYEECVRLIIDSAKGHRILSSPSLSTGDTPLHFAAKLGMVYAVKKLLDSGADVNCVNKFGQSPIHACTSLSECGGDVKLQVLKLLVLHGRNIDVNLTDADKFTALHYAAFRSFHRHPEMASFLIAYGANINIFDFHGLSLLQTECFSTDSDMTILKACVGTFNVLPALTEDINPYGGLPYLAESKEMMREFQKVFIPNRCKARLVCNLCTTTIDKTQANSVAKQSWYNSLSSCPPPLLHTCRNAIRSAMGYRNLLAVKSLQIPSSLKSYLVFGAEMPPN